MCGIVRHRARRQSAVPRADRRDDPPFYDWYADLPPASRQTFGDPTDVPGSGDLVDAGRLIVRGTYTYGFVGLLLARLPRLAAAIWLRREAHLHAPAELGSAR